MGGGGRIRMRGKGLKHDKQIIDIYILPISGYSVRLENAVDSYKHKDDCGD